MAEGKLITTVRVKTVGGHDHVHVWNRGGKAGELVVAEGDGAAVERRLLAPPPMNVRKGQLRNALNERDAWRRRCEEAREERGELRTKVGAMRLRLAAWETRLREVKEDAQSDYLGGTIDELKRCIRELRKALQ